MGWLFWNLMANHPLGKKVYIATARALNHITHRRLGRGQKTTELS
jgi:hypothetical protein